VILISTLCGKNGRIKSRSNAMHSHDFVRECLTLRATSVVMFDVVFIQQLLSSPSHLHGYHDASVLVPAQ
jgi:hypothetical protein